MEQKADEGSLNIPHPGSARPAMFQQSYYIPNHPYCVLNYYWVVHPGSLWPQLTTKSGVLPLLILNYITTEDKSPFLNIYLFLLEQSESHSVSVHQRAGEDWPSIHKHGLLRHNTWEQENLQNLTEPGLAEEMTIALKQMNPGCILGFSYNLMVVITGARQEIRKSSLATTISSPCFVNKIFRYISLHSYVLFCKPQL